MPRVAEVVLPVDVLEEVPLLLRVAEVVLLPLLRVAVELELPLLTVVVLPEPVTVVVRVSEDPEVLTRLRTVVLPALEELLRVAEVVLPLLRVAEVVPDDLLVVGVLAVELLLLALEELVPVVVPEDLVVPVVDGVLEAAVPEVVPELLVVVVDPVRVTEEERLAVVVLVVLEASFILWMSRALVTLVAAEPLPVATLALRTVKEDSGCCFS